MRADPNPADSIHGNLPAESPADGAGIRSPLRRCRQWTARLAAGALAAGLLLVILEFGLLIGGYGYNPSYFVPTGDAGTYVANPRFAQRFFGPDFAEEPLPTTVTARKAEGTYRIFVFGGSAAQGMPGPAFSFARILEAMLNDRYAPTRFEVINTGMAMANSHVVLPLVKDCREFEPDLLIVYLGNDETVGPYGPGTVFRPFEPSRRSVRAGLGFRFTRVGQWIDHTIGWIAERDSTMAPQGAGMKVFLEQHVAADDPRLDAVYRNLEANLRDIAREAGDRDAKVIFSTVVTNLKDQPPFASRHRGDLSATEKTRWNEQYESGLRWQDSGDVRRAIACFHAAEAMDDRFAELHYRLGQCYLTLKQRDRAREHLVRARDFDVLRFRADSRINQIIREVAGGREGDGIYLADAADAADAADSLEGASYPIAGSELLWEHVHLKFEGNYVVAAALFEQVGRLLAREMPESAPAKVEPPSLARCRKVMMFTAYDRARSAEAIAELTAEPPFSTEQGARNRATAEQLRADASRKTLR